MLTAYGRQGDEDAAKEAGILVFQTKPVRQSQLYDCLATGMATGPPDLSQRSSASPEATSVLYGRILLAEDNPVNQEVAEGMLKAFGCQVQVVGNGQAAVNALSHTPYDIVLMDCQMPVMDGFAATAVIRKNKHTLPIIAVTANAIAGDRERCLAAGMNDYLSKPFTHAKLREILERWLPPPKPGQPDEPAINSDAAPTIEHQAWDAIRALQRKGQPDVLAKVMTLYLDSSRTLMEALRQAVPAQDASAVREAAHSLKSSSATLGAIVLAEHCKELEAMGQAQTLVQAAEMLSRLEAEYAAVCEAFYEELHTGHRG
jgi:CheY-like chemotaxis protein